MNRDFFIGLPSSTKSCQKSPVSAVYREGELTRGTDLDIEGDTLLLVQENGASLRLNEGGGLLLSLPLADNTKRERQAYGPIAIIEESVVRQLALGLGFANLLLDHIDGVQRLAHVAIAASIEASDFLGWRTQAEQDASPNTGTMRMSDDELPPVNLEVPRAKLRMVPQELAEDLMVRLRRQRKQRR